MDEGAMADDHGRIDPSPWNCESPWDTGVRPPQPADREDESAPLKDVPQSSLTAETCLKPMFFNRRSCCNEKPIPANCLGKFELMIQMNVKFVKNAVALGKSKVESVPEVYLGLDLLLLFRAVQTSWLWLRLRKPGWSQRLFTPPVLLLTPRTSRANSQEGPSRSIVRFQRPESWYFLTPQQQSPSCK
ncbi:hypothetical protein MJG53_004298 [Ovis ammon polii x Ovis aries]|uniref:Uncharacterized protein n=1 Tax=Ovis ammon polii x Ovis aries TaxID=2918886 RepID=A0ACB9V9X1_9CETA|nr:hypothetical protein MJG53_004298 [Ovis ammon polii x Ovis aries]